MLGLILKDFYNLKSQMKIIVLMLIIYGVIAVSSGNIGMFGAIIAMFSIFLPLSATAYDERANWDAYAMTMPLARKDLATSKYILGCLGILAAALVYIVFAITFFEIPLLELMQIAAGIGLAGLGMQAILLPIVVTIGVEKGRIAMMITALIPVGIGYYVQKLGWNISAEMLTPIIFGLIGMGILLLWGGSLLLSQWLYQRNYAQKH